MSIDYKSISDNFYGGKLLIIAGQTPAAPEYKDLRVPLEQLPPSVQDLWKYQPDKAKIMLTDAGYPNGFDMEVVCQTTDAELLSIYKNYWAKIGINLILDIKENATFLSIYAARTTKQAIYCTLSTAMIFQFAKFADPPTHVQNAAFIVDKRMDDTHMKINAAFPNWSEQCRLFKEVVPYILENSWIFFAPASNTYTVCSHG